MNELTDKKCVTFREGTEPLNLRQIGKYAGKLKTKWEVLENKKIYKEFPFKNFIGGMKFENRVASVAEQENHHPGVCKLLRVEITLGTHNIGGFTENDFVLAARIDELI